MSAEADRNGGVEPQRRPSIWLVGALTALAYVTLGWLFSLLGLPPANSSPLLPAGGLALACVLVFGRPALVGVGIGALALHLLPGSATPLVLPPLMAAGAVAQAWLAVRLVRRHVQQPLTLAEPRDIALFFAFGALLAPTVSATVCVLGVAGMGDLSLAQALLLWLSNWAGDALGTLLATPIVLTLIGRPRSEWAPRRPVVGLSLGAVTALLAIGAVQVSHLDRDRLQADFDRDATNAAAALNYKLQQPLLALEAMRSVFLASEEVTRSQMQRASERWLIANSHIQAMGWSERIPRGSVAAFEARARAEGLPAYTVRNRSDTGTAPADPDVVAIRYIEPPKGNEAALGINAMSVPQARDAILLSLRDNQAAATAGFRLSQDAGDSRDTGLVIYHAIFRDAAETKLPTMRGVVFTTVRVGALLRAAFSDLPAGVAVCIIDRGPLAPIGDIGSSPQRLAGPEGCEQVRSPTQRERTLRLADREWTLRVSSQGSGAASLVNSKSWVVSAVGMPAAALLAALLLSMTGRTQRIESAVAERTAALSEEVREREQAEASMRESEQRFRNIFNNVPIGVVYTDLDGQLQHVNPHFSTLTGYATDELLRMDVYDYLHPDDAGLERQLTRQLLQGEIPMHRGHRRVLRKDGATVWVQSTLTLLRGADGQPRRLVGVIEDITEHLRLVEAERAREQAEAANQAKNEFLSRMSHELRTPLNAMLGFAQLLELDQRHPLPSGQRPWVAQIQQAGWHLLDMINDVLDLSRIESGNLRLHLENLDLEGLVDACLPLVESDAARRGIRIVHDFGAGAVAAVGDITRVKQILINLLSNAVKYNVEQGRIVVSTSRSGDFLMLTVTDSGLGMSPEQMEELFQPFNRLGRERSGLEGTGIGLVISRRLAELMGGSLQAQSSVGIGSSFLLALPIAHDADTVRSDLDPAYAPVPAAHARIVHYVEDNETNIEVMRGILAQRPQVRMAVSMTGLVALESLRREPPDVVLLDMNLPDIDGLELLRRLKADPLTMGLAIVVVSADALGAQIDAALDAGALRYLTKPVSVSEVLRVLDEVFDAIEPHHR